jgi:hypothetical protein
MAYRILLIGMKDILHEKDERNSQKGRTVDTEKNKE